MHELQKHPQRPFPNPLSINNYMAAAVRLPCKSHTKMSLVAHPSWKHRREGIMGDVVQPPIPHTTKPPAVNGFLVTLAHIHISLNYKFQLKTIKTSSFYLTCTIIPYITKTTLTIFPREAPPVPAPGISLPSCLVHVPFRFTGIPRLGPETGSDLAAKDLGSGGF